MKKGGLRVSFFRAIFAGLMEDQVLISPAQFALILDRLAHQLIEHHDFSNTDLVGLQPVAQPRRARARERRERGGGDSREAIGSKGGAAGVLTLGSCRRSRTAPRLRRAASEWPRTGS